MTWRLVPYFDEDVINPADDLNDEEVDYVVSLLSVHKGSVYWVSGRSFDKVIRQVEKGRKAVGATIEQKVNSV